MPIHAEVEKGGGLIGAENCPPWLRLETGVPDCNRTLAPLEAGHELYGLFAHVRAEQDGWSLDTHAGFWRWAIDRWPRTRGNPAAAEQLGYAFRAAQRRGRTDVGAAAALGYSPESMRRMLRRRTRDPLPLDEPVMTDYVLPRVHADIDDEPSPGAYPNLAPHELSRGSRPRARQLRAALESPVANEPLAG